VVVLDMPDATEQVRIEPNLKWIRGARNGRTIVDSRNAQFVWEHRYHPAWYFPASEVHGELVENGETFDSDRLGVGTRYDLVVDGETIPNAARRHLDSDDGLRDLVGVEWSAMDTWFEEDAEVFVHPRDPSTRIDVLPSSRHIKISLDGEVLADTTKASILFETASPPRYYVPKVDVAMQYLTPNDVSTGCPYKGFATYWNVEIGGTTHNNFVWSYPMPLPESAGIAGKLCFYSEKVDVEIDGELQS